MSFRRLNSQRRLWCQFYTGPFQSVELLLEEAAEGKQFVDVYGGVYRRIGHVLTFGLRHLHGLVFRVYLFSSLLR
jgi:hypothetical protein